MTGRRWGGWDRWSGCGIAGEVNLRKEISTISSHIELNPAYLLNH